MKLLSYLVFVLMSLTSIANQVQANQLVSSNQIGEIANARIANAVITHQIIDARTEAYQISVAPVLYKMNAFEVALQYDPKLYQAISVLPESTTCETRLTIAQSIDVDAGRVYLACGSIVPSTVGEVIPLLSVVFERPDSGKSVFQIDEIHSALYRHDGFGTRVQIQVSAD